MRTRCLLVISFIILLSASAHALERAYSIKELPGLPGGTGGRGAYAINEKGQIAGKIGGMGKAGNAFLRSRKNGFTDLGLLKNLPTFPGIIDPPPGAGSTPSAVNDRGEVVGWSSGSSTVTHAFFWSRENGMIDLGTLSPSANGGRSPEWSEARDLNNAGIVVGTSSGRAVNWTWGVPI